MATTDNIRSTNRLPASLSVRPLVRRQITACRKARSAALLVGSTPSTRVKVYKQRQSRSNLAQVVAVLGQAHAAPRSKVKRTIGRSHATVCKKVDRRMVPSRVLSQAANSLPDGQSNRRPTSALSLSPSRSIIACMSRRRCVQ